jgi:hypothetical protein
MRIKDITEKFERNGFLLLGYLSVDPQFAATGYLVGIPIRITGGYEIKLFPFIKFDYSTGRIYRSKPGLETPLNMFVPDFKGKVSISLQMDLAAHKRQVVKLVEGTGGCKKLPKEYNSNYLAYLEQSRNFQRFQPLICQRGSLRDRVLNGV